MLGLLHLTMNGSWGFVSVMMHLASPVWHLSTAVSSSVLAKLSIPLHLHNKRDLLFGSTAESVDMPVS